MKKPVIAAMAAFILVSCQDDLPVSEKCEISPNCEGNVRVFCKDGVLTKESCDGLGRCQAGICVEDRECDDANFMRYCNEGKEVFCENGKIVTRSCGDGMVCVGDVCGAAPECDDDFRTRCEDGFLLTCDGAHIVRKKCEAGQVCVQDSCREVPASCGDGKVEEGKEICDEGPLNGTYGHCRADCQSVSRCGDGTVDAPDEACDDGEHNGTYGHCRTDCQSVSRCGDGTVDAPDEACDDGEANGTYGKCGADCQGVLRCGDGIVTESFEECDPPSQDWLVECTRDCRQVSKIFDDWPRAEDFDLKGDILCTDDDLLSKYLIYRDRFLGNAAKNIPGFVSWGKGPGESLPASFRMPEANCSSMWDFNVSGASCAYSDLPDAKGAYKWGDTTIWLGIMVHWLATEYRMFELLGMDTTETEQYIALALDAFDRLDLAAEEYFGLEGVLDGFFLREDVPYNFHLKGGNYRFVRADAPNKGYECAASMGTCQRFNHMSGEDYLNNGGFTSQDQITGLFEGFGILAAFIPDSVTVDGKSLRGRARAALDRMVRLMRNRSWSIGIEVNGQWLQIPDTWGGYAQSFSGFFAEAADVILGKDFGVETYHDDISKLTLSNSRLILELLWSGWETQNNYNRNLLLRIFAFIDFWDASQYNRRSVESGRDTQALARALFKNEAIGDDFPLWRAAYILSTAPCTGPCNGTSCSSHVPGWMGESYFVTPHDRFGSRHWAGDANGLDYLLMHNLYFSAYAQRTGHSYGQKLPPQNNTEGGLQKILNASASLSHYDARDQANAGDLHLRFCGRPFADWLRDNALGLVDIYTGKTRWGCEMDGKCRLSADSKPYSHRNSLILGTHNADDMNIPAGWHHCVATLGGNDKITAASGFHVIEAGDGDDEIQADGSNVIIDGGPGNDTIRAGSGFHQILGGPGDDMITGGPGTDLIDGGEGNDQIHAGAGDNNILGGAGHDIIRAGEGDNMIWAGDGNDKIRLGNGNNYVSGGDGRNFILLGNGNNTVISHDPQTEDLFICFGTGRNTIWAGWSGKSHCSAAQNSELNSSCKPDLSAEFCSDANFDAWQ